MSIIKTVYINKVSLLKAKDVCMFRHVCGTIKTAIEKKN